MSNFNFLTEWQNIQENAIKAESLVNADPRASCFYSRYTLERMVQWMYEFDTWLTKSGYDNTLNNLINQSDFRDMLERPVFPKIKVVQKSGNEAVHSARKVSKVDSTQAIKELHHILYWFYRTYTSAGEAVSNQVFDLTKVPQTIQIDANLVLSSAKKLKELQAQLAERDTTLQKALEDERAKNAVLRQQLEEARKQRVSFKAFNAQFVTTTADSHDYNEAQTRKFIIDQYLQEMKWNLKAANVKEYKVTGMPSESGIGYVDYVLWGDDGKPLAVVEAKRTTIDAKEGKTQAECYADCLEKESGQRPLIYYTNGYDIYFWDDCNYPPRLVQGFLNRDEMQRLVDRRQLAKPLNTVALDTAIAGKGRAYQRLAIESVCEQFDVHKQRKSLLVMATGTGKTRTTIALVDILMRAGLVKNILFLADRNALVNQDKKEFSKWLPKSSPEILSSGTDQLKGRMYLSTYPTMMNLLGEAAGDRLFGVGHFDLVVIDEAHRSVYKKYRYIFDYFDSLLLGLTATPKAEIDKNTFDIFDLPDGDATYAYELTEAVADGFLVPHHKVSIELGFIRDGIKYNELSQDEQEQWESKAELAEKDEVLPSEVNTFLFNIDTVDKALAVMMEHGIKVAGGNRLGKTIIFAANNAHANFIVERIDASYPTYKGKFARAITYKEKYADTLLDEFKGEKEPVDPELPLSIAVSVDMLDTGVDVPAVVNLMFFKVIKSKVKFMQMLGRGTRLCIDLFGPHDSKKSFKVFDCCQNFEYFDMNPEGASASAAKGLSQAIFEKRLIMSQLVKGNEQFGQYGAGHRVYLIDTLHNRVAGMNLDNFIVRPKRELVEKYTKREIWQHLTNEHLTELEKQIASLPTEATPLAPDEKEQEQALRFDHMLLTMQLGLIEQIGISDYYSAKLINIAAILESKTSVPAVAEQLEWLRYVQSSNFWTDITLEDLEKTRRKLRLLMRFIEKDKKEIVYTNFQDELVGIREETASNNNTAGDVLALYRKKVESYINTHKDNITIARLKRNQPITKLDLEVLEQKLFEASGINDVDKYKAGVLSDKPLGVFIRELVGLDRAAAKAVFADYLDESKFNSQQIHFINTIIDYLTQNGVMNPAMLANRPFSDIHYEGVFGLFDDHTVVELRNTIKRIEALAVGE